MAQYQLNVNEKQLKMISSALDVYSRLESGQFKEVFDRISWKQAGNLAAATSILEDLKILLTGIRAGNLGITQVSNNARIAYDIHQIIRHHLAWQNMPQGGITTDFDKPIQYGNEPLAKIEFMDE